MSDYLNSREVYIEEHKRGKTFSQIAAKYGVSRQCVEQACKKQPKPRTVKESACIYVNIRNWMNQMGISRVQLAEMSIACYNALDRYLTGKADIPKRVIDDLIKITGIPYEELFIVG